VTALLAIIESDTTTHSVSPVSVETILNYYYSMIIVN